MAGTQALTAGRTPAFVFDPADLVIDLPVDDPLHDPRVERFPVTKEDVLLIVTAGAPPIEVRKRGNDNIPIDGKQRTKASLVANALGAGVKYKGKVKPVKAAIELLGQDEDLVEFITKRMHGKPMKLRAVAANAGEEVDMRLRMQARNLHRHDDEIEETKAWAREQSETFGTSVAEIALAVHKSEATVKAWLGAGARKAGAAKKMRGPSSRVPMAALREALEAGSSDLSQRDAALLRMTLEGIDAPGFIEAFPVLATTLKEATGQ